MDTKCAILLRRHSYKSSKRRRSEVYSGSMKFFAYCSRSFGAARDVVGIRRGAISGNMKVSFQAARSIG